MLTSVRGFDIYINMTIKSAIKEHFLKLCTHDDFKNSVFKQKHVRARHDLIGRLTLLIITYSQCLFFTEITTSNQTVT